VGHFRSGCVYGAFRIAQAIKQADRASPALAAVS
jgi:hypothetical protein